MAANEAESGGGESREPTAGEPAWRSVVGVPGMDCSAEETLVRAALANAPQIEGLSFDLPARRLTVTHRLTDARLLEAVAAAGLGAELVSSTRIADAPAARPADRAAERAVLRWVLAINALMFVVELGVGWIAESTGLLADSIDMLADASVYAISLYVVGRGEVPQRRAAQLSGALQMTLALTMLLEVGRRALFGSDPASLAMMGMAAVALAANLLCVWLLRRHRDGGAHMRASWIFTTADVLANLGVIVAGGLVSLTGSAAPDLVVGAVIALVVMRSAVRILRLR